MNGMVGIMNNPAESMNSHSAGWNMIIKEFIGNCTILNEKDDWNRYDALYVNHGLNFKPGLYNIIGGINEGVITRLKKLNNFGGFKPKPLFSVDGFDPTDFINKRNINYSFTKNIMPWSIPIRANVVIGDSHAISVWPGTTHGINRLDGKTLYGFLKNPIYFDRKDIILYFGNIDVRFHLCRQPDPFYAAEMLIDRYMEYAEPQDAKICHLLPVEDESRKIPGTGLYKGQKFFGSQQLRQKLVDFINEKMTRDYHKSIPWPDWFMKDGKMNMEIMEPRQSVHIRPKYYPRYARQDSLF